MPPPIILGAVLLLHLLFVGFLVFLSGCATDGVPGSAREPTPSEWAVIDRTRMRWETFVAPLSNECAARVGRVQVIDALTTEQKLAWCWRGLPGDVDASIYGNCGACPAQRTKCSAWAAWFYGECTTWPLIIVAHNLDMAGHDYAVAHEMWHLMGICSRVPSDSHQEEVWRHF